MLRNLIIADLAKGQSTLDSLSQRLRIDSDVLSREIKIMIIEGEILKLIISEFLPVYRLTEKTLQALSDESH